MKISPTTKAPNEQEASAIVIGIWQDESLSAAAADLDQACNGRISKLIEMEEVSAAENSVAVLYAVEGVPSPVIALVGQGKRDEQAPGLAFRVAGAATKALCDKERASIAYYLDFEDLSDAVCGAMVACVGQDLYRAESKLHAPGEMIWYSSNSDTLELGEVLGQATNLTRELVNRPACDIYPESLAEWCQEMAQSTGLEIEVWDEDRLKSENCNSLLAVAQGSDRPPRLVIMKHMHGPDGQAPLALVGKGVTFDSGGLSLKPGDAMIDMKMDMAGSATVVGAMNAIANLKLPVNVIAVIGCVENMVSGSSYKLGDVLTARSGKTIEVLNTDAEGRLVLADALNVACELGAAKLVDLATLTGACMVALGRYHAGLMTNDQAWCDAVAAAAEKCGEPVWQLPMDKVFADAIKSNIADIKNVGDGRWGGAMTAAKLLEEFVEDLPWTHMDIAGPAFGDKPRPWIDAGATGTYVRTLVELARQFGQG